MIIFIYAGRGCFEDVVQIYDLNTLRPRQNGRHFPDDIFKHTFLNENVRIPIKISLKFVPKGPINNISALVQIMAWRRTGDKPLSEPMIVKLPTHICVTRPQWVNSSLKPFAQQQFMYYPATLYCRANLEGHATHLKIFKRVAVNWFKDRAPGQ